MIDRALRLPLMRRALASIRWRSGLDDDLRALGERIASVESVAQARIHELQEAAVASVRELGSRIESVELGSASAVGELSATLEAVDRSMQPATVWAEILLHTNWSALVPLTSEPTISVVLATRDRPHFLRRAVDSVLAQTYPRWELIVVDDGASADSRAVVEAVADERVSLVDGDGSGASSARNLGLQAASGSIVAYLDDDNLMAPAWLRSVAVAFQEPPDVSAVYGAQLRAGEQSGGAAPSLLFVSPFDWERLIGGNYIDIGMVAHRSGLENLSFDEGLLRLGDWDLVVNLAGRFGIEPLPVVASLYTTDAPCRLTDRRMDKREVERLQQRFRDAFGTRPPDSSASLATRGSTKAWATPGDADLLEEILLRLGGRFDGRLSVLEWGSGLSTLHYPAWLVEQGIQVSWTVIEHDRGLFREALEADLRDRGARIVMAEELEGAGKQPNEPGITAVVFDEGRISPFDENPLRYVDREKDLDDYVGLPASLGLRFHVVIVDGRKRRRCLIEAASLLEERGVAVLHDAQRPYYHSAFGQFASGRRVGDELWIGAQYETDFTDVVPDAALAVPGFDYVPGT
jgi:glycosyltransferase involved in cell wall biosynthesis